MTSKLMIRINAPVGTMVAFAEARVLVDDEDLVATWFPEGYGVDPDIVLGPQGELQAGDQPRQVTIGRPDCDPGCCGSLEVRIRRDGDHVVWDRWITPHVDRVPTGEIRFGADDYAAELARAYRDRSWEWTGRTVARLLLADDSALLARFGRSPEYVIPWPAPEADSISVHVPAPPDWAFDPPNPMQVSFHFDDRDLSVQAAELLAVLAEASQAYGREIESKA
jgi:hypothetical protein